MATQKRRKSILCPLNRLRFFVP